MAEDSKNDPSKSSATNKGEASKSNKSDKDKDKFALDLVEVTEPNLFDINLEMKSGEFMAIVGQVGCGKTSFLYSVMDETILLNGSKLVRGSMGYVE